MRSNNSSFAAHQVAQRAHHQMPRTVLTTPARFFPSAEQVEAIVAPLDASTRDFLFDLGHQMASVVDGQLTLTDQIAQIQEQLTYQLSQTAPAIEEVRETALAAADSLDSEVPDQPKREQLLAVVVIVVATLMTALQVATDPSTAIAALLAWLAVVYSTSDKT